MNIVWSWRQLVCNLPQPHQERWKKDRKKKSVLLIKGTGTRLSSPHLCGLSAQDAVWRCRGCCQRQVCRPSWSPLFHLNHVMEGGKKSWNHLNHCNIDGTRREPPLWVPSAASPSSVRSSCGNGDFLLQKVPSFWSAVATSQSRTGTSMMRSQSRGRSRQRSPSRRSMTCVMLRFFPQESDKVSVTVQLNCRDVVHRHQISIFKRSPTRWVAIWSCFARLQALSAICWTELKRQLTPCFSAALLRVSYICAHGLLLWKQTTPTSRYWRHPLNIPWFSLLLNLYLVQLSIGF